MASAFPDRIEFEIDHSLVRKYYQQQAALFCVLGGFPLGMIGLSIAIELLRGYYGFGNTQPIYAPIIAGMFGFFVWVLFAASIYFIFFHGPSKTAADNLRLAVEGPYLRVVSGALFVTDRRIHFKDLSDYCTQTGPMLRRLGMKSLTFRANGIGIQRNGVYIEIPGLKHVDEVRDKLSLIDAERET